MPTSNAMTQRGTIALHADTDGLRLQSPYDPQFIDAFKLAIPAAGRRWDSSRKVWLVAPQHGPALVQVITQHFGVPIELPAIAAAAPVLVTEVIQLAYLGACKAREGGAISASGYLLGNRNAKAPDLTISEAALTAWFDMGAAQAAAPAAKPAQPGTLYGVLCVPPSADSAAIKSAYRRMARQTHPDVNKEPDAADQFRRVQAAYDTLSDTLRRRKYDAGLVLADRAKQPAQARTTRLQPHYTLDSYYRSPLRCGLLVVQGTKQLGRLVVDKIMSWSDLERNGLVLVSSWPQYAEIWLESWVTP